MESLVGLTVSKAEINDGNDLIVLTTDKGVRYLTWEGYCCSLCFLAHVNNTKALLNSKIIEVQAAEWKTLKDNEDDYEVIENMGTIVTTTSGIISFETRLEHNGYYAGMIYVSDDEPIDQYHSPRMNWEKDELRPLEDF